MASVFEKQNKMVRDTWLEMSRNNFTPDDVDLYDMIMDNNSGTSVFKILHHLVKCLVPSGSSNYDKDLAVKFETTMKGAAKSCLENGGKMPKSLVEFIGSIETDAFAFVQQTDAFAKAEDCFYDLKIEDMKYFDPEDPVYNDSTSSSPYLSAAEYIANRGKLNFVVKLQQVPDFIKMSHHFIYILLSSSQEGIFFSQFVRRL